MPKRTRKPLRRTAWSLFLGGLTLFVPRFTWTVARLGNPWSKAPMSDVWGEDELRHKR
ncbi:MAG: hypothetical protein M3548_00215 [Actinomycetota bacterium]|nr:hypothetical protein [Actinomycetota bacterium]